MWKDLSSVVIKIQLIVTSLGISHISNSLAYAYSQLDLVLTVALISPLVGGNSQRINNWLNDSSSVLGVSAP